MYGGQKVLDQYGNFTPKDLVALCLSEMQSNLLLGADMGPTLDNIIHAKWYDIEGQIFVSDKKLPDFVEGNPSPIEFFRDDEIRQAYLVDDVLKRWDIEAGIFSFWHA